jgi:sodium/hydrogen antiporter
VLSLTVVRMLPVAISLLGSRVDWATVAFLGWFGPRGLASIVFALIALEDLHGVEGPIEEVVGAIGLTVLLSVLAHGLSARPLAGQYAAHRSGPRRRTASRASATPVRQPGTGLGAGIGRGRVLPFL